MRIYLTNGMTKMFDSLECVMVMHIQATYITAHLFGGTKTM